MTDIQLIMEVLKDRKPHHVLEIMHRVKPGAVNFAARTRVSEIKKIIEPEGYTIKSVKDPVDQQAIYQIVKIAQEAPEIQITHYTLKEGQKTNLAQKNAVSCHSSEPLVISNPAQQELIT